MIEKREWCPHCNAQLLIGIDKRGKLKKLSLAYAPPQDLFNSEMIRNQRDFRHHNYRYRVLIEGIIVGQNNELGDSKMFYKDIKKSFPNNKITKKGF